MTFPFYDGTSPPSLDEFIQEYIDRAINLSNGEREMFYGLYAALGILDMYSEAAFEDYIFLYGTNVVPLVYED